MQSQFKVVVFDETHLWSREVVRAAGGKIYASYLFDALLPIHPCSLRPAFFLHHLFSTPLNDDDDVGSVTQIIWESEIDDQSKYFDCSFVQRQPTVYDFGLESVDCTSPDDEEYKALEDRLIDYCKANRGGFEFPRALPLAA